MARMAPDAPIGTSWAPLLTAAGPLSADSKERLFAALYADLHHLAERQLRRNGGIAISATTLLHETYLSVSRGAAEFPDRPRFLAYASRVMRSLIIDCARQRRAEKHGGGFRFTQLQEELVDSQSHPAGDAAQLAKLSDALDELAQLDPTLAELVDLRYFCGFSVAEIAALRGVSLRTIDRDWQKARTALYDALRDPPP
jgi:RNA polymerase sigma factor (TIGR02999 family)